MKKTPLLTKSERRAQKKRPRMAVQGASVKTIQRILIARRHQSKK